MAVPKSKVSKQRGNTRFANWKLKSLNLVECSQCHALKKSHEVCPECGGECEVYSRIVGYIRPIKQWNKGKQAEFKIRKTFNLKEIECRCNSR